MKPLLSILAALLLSACSGAALRGTGDLGIVIERATGSVAVVDSSAKGILGRVEGLEGQVQHHRAVLADRIEHHRLFALGDHLPHDLDALGLQALEVGQGAMAQHVVHAIFTTVRPVTRPLR